MSQENTETKTLSGKLAAGDKFVGIGGLLLLCLFVFPWFNWIEQNLAINLPGYSTNPAGTITVWKGFPFFSYIFFLAGLISVGVILFKLIRSVNIPSLISYGIAALALVTVVVISLKIISPPATAQRGSITFMSATVTPAISLYVALFAALTILIGGLLSIHSKKRLS